MNFESPYVDMPMRLTVRQNLDSLRPALRGEGSAGRIDGSPPISISGTSSTGATGKLSAGQKTARRARQGADQRARIAAARRADRLARPRHRRLGPHASAKPTARPPAPPSCSPRTTCCEVERLCDRVIIMKRGRIDDDDSPVGADHGALRPRTRSKTCSSMSRAERVAEGTRHDRVTAHPPSRWRAYRRDGPALLVSA